jgi:Phage capsid protein
VSMFIDAAFIKQFESEVFVAFQRKGSKLKPTVRVKSGIVGSSTVFPKVGTGVATQKGRHAQITPMNVGHAQVECFLSDWYAGDWVDKFDLLKTNIDERQIVADAGAYALGRKVDDLVIVQLNTATSVEAINGTAGFTKAKVQNTLKVINNADVPDDGGRFCLLGPQQWNDALNITEFANSQYVGEGNAPWMQSVAVGQVKQWLGVYFMMHSGLQYGVKTANTRQCQFYHRTAVGLAFGSEVISDVTWHGDMASWWVNNMLSAGAVLIESTNGVREIDCYE